jgi:hypothetical protein
MVVSYGRTNELPSSVVKLVSCLAKGRVVEELYWKKELLVTETVVPITTDNLKQCIEFKVFNSEPWNESWTYETAKERLTDLFHAPKFAGFFWKNNETPIGFIAGNSKTTYQEITFYLEELRPPNKKTIINF